MGFIVSLVLIAALAFSAFCFYSGVSSIGEKLKKDGLYSVVEVAFIIFIATALVLMAVGKVNSLLFRPQTQNAVRVIDV